jgi:DNA-binding NarL/FixJ family response regulator
MSIRLLVAYHPKAMSDDVSSLIAQDHDIEWVGMVNSHQLNAQVFETFNPHLVVVGHMTNRHELTGVHNTDLGGREAQVLKLVAVGRTSKEIARHLDISPNTVDVHRRNIMRKLGLHKAADLTRFAIRHHMI